MSLGKVPGIHRLHLLPGDKISGGADTRHSSPPWQQHSPSWDCWSGQKELLHLLVSAAQDLLCFCQRAEFHPTLLICASAGQMAPWWQPAIIPHLELLARSATEGRHARGSKCLAFSSAPLPSAEVSLVFNPSASWLGQLLHSQALSYIRSDFIPKSLTLKEHCGSSILHGLLSNVHWISSCWQTGW